jgi:anti-anti-sigma factor
MTESTAEEAIDTITLPECIDSASATSVEKSLLETLRPGARVIADGHAVTYLSAAGVRVFATVLHRAKERGAQIVFCRFAGPAADCLLVSGFAKLVDVAGSVEEAAIRLRPVLDPGLSERLHPRGAAG